MNASITSRMFGLLAGLLVLLAAAPPSQAAFGSVAQQAIKGTVQNIDYLHHAITVNGQTYAVAQHAQFIGVAGFTVLHVGMPIAYTLGAATSSQGAGTLPPGPAEPNDPSGQAADTGPPVITSITWLPGGV